MVLEAINSDSCSKQFRRQISTLSLILPKIKGFDYYELISESIIIGTIKITFANL